VGVNKYFLIFVIYIVIVFAALIVWQQTSFGESPYYSSTESQEIARQWVLNNSPTYKFDGFDLKITESKIGRCFSCFEFTFSFKSRHAGYGNREGEILAQVVTPHAIVLNTRQGEVIQAITDQKYDEMAGDFLSSEKGS